MFAFVHFTVIDRRREENVGEIKGRDKEKKRKKEKERWRESERDVECVENEGKN